jgi:positive regulator of sigma E activity
MIAHKGIVKEVKDNSVLVRIISESACSACHSKGSCLVAGKVEKEVEVYTEGRKYFPGNEVNIFLKESLGLKAVFLGYLLPFIVLVVVLFTVIEITGNELEGGISSIAAVGLYYTTLLFFRKHLKKVFNFELEETNNQ